MARGDGVDRISVRNVNLSNAKISNTQRHVFGKIKVSQRVSRKLAPQMA